MEILCTNYASHSPQQPHGIGISFPFYRWGKEWLIHLFKVTQSVSGGGVIWTQTRLIPQALLWEWLCRCYVTFDLGARLPGFKSLLSLDNLITARPGPSNLFFLYLRFHICNVGGSGSTYLVVLFWGLNVFAYKKLLECLKHRRII